MKRILLMAVTLGTTLFFNEVLAAAYQIPTDGSDIVGEIKTVQSRQNDTLNRIAIRNGVGYNEIVLANPHLKKHKKLTLGTDVIVPTAYNLPKVDRSGIVINLSAMRLYYFPDESTVVTYPVAVGKRGWSTPQGVTKIIAKKRNPTWIPPKSIIREAAKRGRKLRRIYSAGPNNPLGTRALRLGIAGYLIHGTNKPWTIGKRRSHGCIRMRRNDIESLFSKVSVGTRVQIITQPFEMPSLTATRESSQQIDDDSIVINDVPRQAQSRKKTIKTQYSGVRVKRSSVNRRSPKRENYNNNISQHNYSDPGYQNLTGGDPFTNSFEE